MERAKYATVLCCRAGRKHGRKTEQQNGLSEQFKLSGFFPFLGFAFSTTKFTAFFFPLAIIMVSLTLFSSFAQALAIDM